MCLLVSGVTRSRCEWVQAAGEDRSQDSCHRVSICDMTIVWECFKCPDQTRERVALQLCDSTQPAHRGYVDTGARYRWALNAKHQHTLCLLSFWKNSNKMCLWAAYTHFIIFILPRWKTAKMDYGLRKNVLQKQLYSWLYISHVYVYFTIFILPSQHTNTKSLYLYQHTVILLAILQIYLWPVYLLSDQQRCARV